MSRTKLLREQHEDLSALVLGLQAFLKSDLVVENAEVIRKNLSTLAGKLKVHLAMEDKVLYPELLNHVDSQVSSLAQKYFTEHGGIKESFSEYSRKWAGATTIRNQPEDFIKETTALFSVLKRRIERENGELYKIADAL